MSQADDVEGRATGHDALLRRIEGLVVHYGSLESTQRAVTSILASGVGHVTVWNNGPDAFELQPADVLPHTASQVSIDTAGENLGFAAAVNRALALIRVRLAGSGAVLLLNNDALIAPDGTVRLEEALRAQPNAVVAFPIIDHSGWKRGAVYYHRWTGLITSYALPGSFAYASGCCMLIALDAAPEKLFDEAFFLYGEDIELGRRLAGLMVAVNTCLVSHAANSGSGARSPLYERRIIHAQMLLADRLSTGPVSRLWLRAMHLVMLVLRAVWRSARFKSRTPLRALRDTLIGTNLGTR